MSRGRRGGSGNAQHGDEPSRYDCDDLHDTNPLVLGARTGRPSGRPYSALSVQDARFNQPTFRLNRRGNGSQLFVALAMDWFKCDWEDREGCRSTKWSHASRPAAMAKVPVHCHRCFAVRLPVGAYPTTADASNLLPVFPVSFAEADHHMGR